MRILSFGREAVAVLLSRARRRILSFVHSTQLFIYSKGRSIRVVLAKIPAHLWRLGYLTEDNLFIAVARRRTTFVTTIIAVAYASILLSLFLFKESLESFFETNPRIQGNLDGIFLTLGGAFVGAAAIAFSLAMFVVQINVDRVSYGLFANISRDRRLILAFVAMIIIAILLSILPTLRPLTPFYLTISLGMWSIISMIGLLLFGYNRTLTLISPFHHLSTLVQLSNRHMSRVARRANRLRPILEQKEIEPTDHTNLNDAFLTAFFQANFNWTAAPIQAIQHATAAARFYSTRNDHEVSAVALDAIVQINLGYIDAKGRTFYSNSLLLTNPLSTDSVINEALEELRVSLRYAISRSDERFIEQCLKTFLRLTRAYMTIQYSGQHNEKSHANLAGHYLANGVEDIVPHGMIDPLLEGIRLLGECARLTVSVERSEMSVVYVEKMAHFAVLGLAARKYRVLVSEVVKQFSTYSIALLGVERWDIGFAARETRKLLVLIVRAYLAEPGTEGRISIGNPLSEYYSGAIFSGFLSHLTNLTNAILDEGRFSREFRHRLITNLENWSEGSYEDGKQILLESIEKKDNFAYDVIGWICQVSSILFIVSSVEDIPESTRRDLERNAAWLLSMLSWIPEDRVSVTFVDVFAVSDTIFDVCVEAHRRDIKEFIRSSDDAILRWCFLSERFGLGGDTAAKCLLGLAALLVVWPSEEDELSMLASLSEVLGRADDGLRDKVASEVEEYINESWSDLSLSKIELAASGANRQQLNAKIRRIADFLRTENRS